LGLPLYGADFFQNIFTFRTFFVPDYPVPAFFRSFSALVPKNMVIRGGRVSVVRTEPYNVIAQCPEPPTLLFFISLLNGRAGNARPHIQYGWADNLGGGEFGHF